jgi:hypothetical protein
MARVNKDAYRQGLRDSLLGVTEQANPYGGNSVADGVARRSWRIGLAHGKKLMAAANEFASATQCALGAQQQGVVDAAFIEQIGECFEVAI